MDRHYDGCPCSEDSRCTVNVSAELEARIRALGGKPGSDVTRKTGYLVVGADPGSKLARAQSLGIKILDENEFLQMLQEAEAGLI